MVTHLLKKVKIYILKSIFEQKKRTLYISKNLKWCVGVFIVVILINCTTNAYSQTATNPYTFTLKTAAQTSAGVYSNGVLVRTLWTLVSYDAGSHPIYWDGKDDDGNTLPSGNYVVKVLSNNIQTNWLGGIGNTSANFTGTTVHHGYGVPISVCAVGNKVYYATGYSEVSPSLFSFSSSAPQVKIDVVPYGTTTKYTSHLCSDGVKLYTSGYDPYPSNTPSYVSAINVSDNSKVTFPSGVNYAQTIGNGNTESAIAFLATNNAFITGLAVQNSGNYLFLTRSSLNTLYVINKTTGAIVQTVTSLTAPKELCTDISGNLWISYNINTIEKFKVNANGTLTTTGITLKGCTKPGPMAITTDGSKINVIDYNDSKLYLYNNLTGGYVSSFGKGGYASTSVVASDRFAFAGYDAAVSYAGDGSFWVTDGSNTRLQHFDSNYSFIESVQFQPPVYSVNVDNSNPQNVFGNYLEYNVDYTKTISGSTGWSFTNNWGGQISGSYNTMEGFKAIHTFTVGGISRIFAFLRVNAYRSGFELVELQTNGVIRFTGIIKDWFIIDDNGALILGDGQVNGGGLPVITKKYAFSGIFDSSNNPVWNSTPEILADFSNLNNTKDQQLLAFSSCVRNFVTQDNKVIIYQPGVWVNGTPANGYVNCNHLAAIPKNGKSFLWQTAKSTPSDYNGAFPDPSYFDIGNNVNNYAGSDVNVQGNIIVTGYHGEFWKQGQTNKYNIYYSDGLSLGQFGTTTYDSYGEAPAGLAGNALSPQLIRTSNNRLILWHGDESRSGKIQAWEILGENTIDEQSINIVYPDSALNIPSIAGVDLMAGLTSGNFLQDGQFGWSRSSGELKTSSETFSALIDNNSLYPNSPNLNIKYRVTDANSIVSITRTLENTSTLNSWALSGKLSWDLNAPNDVFLFDGTHNCNGSYIEILDDKNNIITRFYTTYTITGGVKIQVIGNDKTLINDSEANMKLIQNHFQPFSINCNGNNITFNYAGYSQTTNTLINATANALKPASLRFYFYQNYNGTQNNDKVIDLLGLRFVKKLNQNLIFNKITLKHYGDAPFTLTATSTSNLPVSYTIVSGPAKISGKVITVTGAGIVIIQAEQPGNNEFDPATPVLQSFTVNPIRVDL